MKLLRQLSIVTDPEEITGVGHRVVAGGEAYKQSVIVGDDDVAQIKALPNTHRCIIRQTGGNSGF